MSTKKDIANAYLSSITFRIRNISQGQVQLQHLLRLMRPHTVGHGLDNKGKMVRLGLGWVMTQPNPTRDLLGWVVPTITPTMDFIITYIKSKKRAADQIGTRAHYSTTFGSSATAEQMNLDFSSWKCNRAGTAQFLPMVSVTSTLLGDS